jgi:exopolysaccharide biosynthesis polyprenyl glycosylphosphotransferase
VDGIARAMTGTAAITGGAAIDAMPAPAALAELAARRASRRPGPIANALTSPLLVAAADVAALAAGVTVADRFDLLSIAYVLAVPLWFAMVGSYRRRIATSLRSEVLPLLGAASCPLLILALVGGPAARHLFGAAPIMAVLLVAGRALAYTTQRAARARTPGEPVLIVGAGALGCQLARSLLQHREYGLRPVGFVDGFPDDRSLPLPILADIGNLDAAVRATGATRLIVAFGAHRESDTVAALRASDHTEAEVHILPRLFELGVAPNGPATDMVWGFPVQHARRAALRSPSWRTKRVMDVAVSAALLVVLGPAMLAVAAILKLSGGGPVLFRQRRLGQRGHVVEILKFRSMRLNDEADTRWGTAADDRVTALGRVLRATNVDELPQLINVLKGDMSLVGPRPERPHFAQQFDTQIMRYRDRLRVPVGLTGWAQVHGLRGDTSIEERARFDNYYIEHWSLAFDVAILCRTALQVAGTVLAAARGAVRRAGGNPVATPSSLTMVASPDGHPPGGAERSGADAEGPVDVDRLPGDVVPSTTGCVA